jgi:hypothetical protein
VQVWGKLELQQRAMDLILLADLQKYHQKNHFPCKACNNVKSKSLQ